MSTHLLNQGETRASQLVLQLERLLLDGGMQVGMRLPAERALAERFGVSRTTVREAIAKLVARGMLITHQGSGVFVSDRLQSGLISPWRQLVADHPEMREDMLEFRHALEAATAYYAALRANEAERARIGAVVAQMQAAYEAGDIVLEASLDAQFHEAIAEASHNVMFRHLYSSVIKMLREHITLNGKNLRAARGAVGATLLSQHQQILAAIIGGEADQAKTAMLTHIDFVRARLEEQDDD